MKEQRGSVGGGHKKKVLGGQNRTWGKKETFRKGKQEGKKQKHEKLLEKTLMPNAFKNRSVGREYSSRKSLEPSSQKRPPGGGD